MANPSPPDGGLRDAGADASAAFPPNAVDDPTGTCGTPKDAADWSGGVPPPPIVTPIIWIQTPIVLVKKPYTAKPKRQPVLLTTDDPSFDGTGTFTVTSGAGAIRFFSLDVGGAEIESGHVFSGDVLNPGTTIYAEGAKPSTAEKDVTVQLELTRKSKPVKGPVTSKMTSVEVTLDICKSRTKAGEDPAPLSTDQKINVGRFVQVQDAGINAARAMLVVQKAKPPDFAGTLVLAPKDPHVRMFAAADDPPAAGQIPLATAKKGNGDIPAKGMKFWAEGVNVSGALRDTGFKLGVEGVDSEGDIVNVTVVQFTEIKATIKPTPPNTPANTAAAGLALPLDHVFKSAGLSRDFAANAPLVLIRNAQPDTVLQVTCAPAGLPILWQAIRNEDDHNSLGKSGDLPTVTQDGADPKRAKLNANSMGSFRIRAYIDCNDTAAYEDKIDREPSIPLSLVLANAVVVKDNSAGNVGGVAGNLRATVAGGTVEIENGLWPPAGAALTKGDLKKAGMGMELIADITGGGADGRLGLDKVFAGLVNNLRVVDINATYRDSTVAPPKDFHWINVYVSNRPATGIFTPADPAPIPYAWPLLDTGRHPGEGTGGEMATMGRSLKHTSTDNPVGQRWTIRCVDRPKRSFGFTHPLNASAVIRQVHYRQEFTANFCFWTNVSKSRGATGDPADRVYSVLQIVTWNVLGDWDVTFPGGVPILTVTAAHRVLVPSHTTVKPIERAQDHGVEVRPPSGITGAIAWDGR